WNWKRTFPKSISDQIYCLLSMRRRLPLSFNVQEFRLDKSNSEIKDIKHFKTDKCTLHFVHQFSSTSPRTLFYFCPDTKQFTIIQDMYYPKMGQALGRFYFDALPQLRFTDLFRQHTFSQFHLFELWGKEKKNFRLRQRTHLYGKELAWHQWL